MENTAEWPGRGFLPLYENEHQPPEWVDGVYEALVIGNHQQIIVDFVVGILPKINLYLNFSRL